MSRRAVPAQNSKASVRYLETDVLTEAKRRIRLCFDTFDRVYVAFSGGKDSLVVLHLTREVQQEMGIPGPTRCLFFDEELIPSGVIEFVQSYQRDTENWDMLYLAVPMQSQKYILGTSERYIQWDPARPWVRPKPENSIQSFHGFDGVIFNQHNLDTAVFNHIKERCVTLNGIRADESLIRYQSCINAKKESWLGQSDSVRHLSRGKPIYDWSQHDVFKYFHERSIKYCPIYDEQLWARQAFRVATPLTPEGSKNLHKLKRRDPLFYDQLLSVFPEAAIQERYWKEYDRRSDVIDKYPHTWGGILQMVEDKFHDEPDMKAMAIAVVHGARRRRVNKQREAAESGSAMLDPFGGMPLLFVMKAIANGAINKGLQCTKTFSREMYEYEGFPVPEGVR
jgi:predicted phosphoadenosine phosphosulfate sulfurtransferase